MDRDGGSLVVEWYKHNHRNNDFHNMAAWNEIINIRKKKLDLKL